MIRAYVFTLDPSPRQERMLRSHCGASRKAYNTMLATVRANLDQRNAERSYGISDDDLTPVMNWSAYSLRKHWNSIKDDAAPWWGEVSKEAFSTGCANLASALKNWSDAKRGKRKGRSGFPRFQSRRSRQSCTFTTGTIRLEASRHHVTLPRLGQLHLHESSRRLCRLIEQGRAKITQATISYRHGRWQVSLLAHVAARQTEPRGAVVGIDLGVKDLLVAATPDREVARVPVPTRLRDLETRRRMLQRRNRHRQGPRKGQAPSRRWLRAQRRIDRLDWQMSRIREDALHKITTDLARTYGTVVVEDLNVAGMMTRGGSRKRGLNRAIARASMSTVKQMLTYKTEGRLVVVDRFYPSSKTCSECGSVKAKLALSERTYVCPACGAVVDRDLNAAINLARKGLAGSGPVSGRGAERKTSAPSGVGAAGSEASTSQSIRSSDEDRLLVTAGSVDGGADALIH